MQNLQQSCSNTGVDISIYSGNLTNDCLLKSVKRIKEAFPQLTPGFYDILQEMIKKDNFCDSRLIDAVDHVIRNCRYPNPTIAEFISYDKKMKIYTYNECIKIISDYGVKLTDMFIHTEEGWRLK